MKKVVFLDAETMDLPSLDTTALDSLNADVTLYQQTQHKDVAERIHNADAVLVNKVVLSADDLQRAFERPPKKKNTGSSKIPTVTG